MERDPRLVRSSKRVELDGIRVEFEGQAGQDAWRVLVNDQPAAMTYSETETTTTNASSYETVLRAPARVEWAPLGRALQSPAPAEVTRSKRGLRVAWDITRSKVEMYNTVIYDSETLMLVLAPDLASVSVSLLCHTDSSS